MSALKLSAPTKCGRRQPRRSFSDHGSPPQRPKRVTVDL